MGRLDLSLPRPHESTPAVWRGTRTGEAETLNELGALHRITGDFVQAEQCHQQALELARAIGSTWIEAHALAGLGRCAIVTSGAAQAAALLRQALELFQRIGATDDLPILAELDALTNQGSAE